MYYGLCVFSLRNSLYWPWKFRSLDTVRCNLENIDLVFSRYIVLSHASNTWCCILCSSAMTYPYFERKRSIVEWNKYLASCWYHTIWRGEYERVLSVFDKTVIQFNLYQLFVFDVKRLDSTWSRISLITLMYDQLSGQLLLDKPKCRFQQRGYELDLFSPNLLMYW